MLDSDLSTLQDTLNAVEEAGFTVSATRVRIDDRQQGNLLALAVVGS